MKTRGLTVLSLEPIIIVGFGTAGKFETAWKFRTPAECVEALRRHTYLRLGFNGRGNSDLKWKCKSATCG